jgi:putative membrane protein
MGIARSPLVSLNPFKEELVMAQISKKSLAALCAAAALSTYGAAAAQEVALAQDSPESKFLTDAVRGDLAEVKLGELAQQKGQSEGVKAFGEMLVEDHSKALKQTAELAKDLDVIPPALPTAEQTEKHDALARLSGAEFDRQFAAEMVKGHEEEIAKYRRQAESGDSKVAELAEELLPTLEEHLAAAQRLQSGDTASHDRPHD